jgi:ABC-2 type transport system ATP-binding protein
MPAAIETHGLTKDYGGARGLFDLDLTVASGEVLGYLGPNGAGKTTTIRLLMDMIRPTRGSAFVFGLDCRSHSSEVKRLVGYLPGELPQFGGLKGSEVVSYLGGLRGGLDRTFVAELARRFDLDLGRPYREYSRGNKQKLAIVLAFMHRPQLLIVDEPTSGLDPLNQQEFYRLVAEARDEGATVFLSSHVLSEVEHVCDRVGIIRSGRLVQLSGLDELHHIRVHQVEIEFEGAPPNLEGVAGVESVELREGRVTCTVRGSFEPLMKALEDVHVVNLVSHEPSLEDVFLTYYRDRPALPAPVG